MFKRGGVWWACFRLNGRKIRRSLGTANKRLAESVEAKIRTEVIEGKYFDKSTGHYKTFSDLAQKYLEEQTPCKSPGSQLRDKGIFEKHLIPAFGIKTLTSIRTKDISTFKQKRKQSGASGETLNKELGLMKAAFNIAVKEWEWVKENPVCKVKMEKKPEGRVRYLQDEEFERLFQSCEPWLRPIVIVARYTGLRMANVLNLKWDQINLFRREILIENEAMKNDEAIGIPVCDTLFECLKGLQSYKVRNIEGKVFDYPYGFKAFQRRVQRAFKMACEKVGIENFRWHDLRHDFASMLVQGGTDIYIVQTLLGHKDGRMTKRYAHLSQENLRVAIRVLDKKKTDTENLGHNLDTVSGLH